MNYQNVVSTVVRALAAETINSAGGCDFEPKVQAAKQKGAIVDKEAAFLFDCMVFVSRLHKNVSAEHWRHLVAKYSTHVDRKPAAIEEITCTHRSPAPQRFRHCAILTWAMPKLPGVDGKRSTRPGTRWITGATSRIQSRLRSAGGVTFARPWKGPSMRL